MVGWRTIPLEEGLLNTWLRVLDDSGSYGFFDVEAVRREVWRLRALLEC